MNHLAHAYLSFGNKDILLGNMIADYVKGRKQYDYPYWVHKGIVLHRMIDTFTDEHQTTHEAKELFKKDYRLYGGAFVDVVYDHFLAKDISEFPGDKLFYFSLKTYRMMDKQRHIMPEGYKRIFFFMRMQNWLYGYRKPSGIHQGFKGVVRRSTYLHDSKAAEQIFEKHYKQFAQYYREFWKDLKLFAEEKFNELLLMDKIEK